MFSYADKQREPRFQKFDEGRAHDLVRSKRSFTPKYYKKFCTQKKELPSFVVLHLTQRFTLSQIIALV